MSIYEKILVPPTYGYSKANMEPYKPTMREVLLEWGDSVNAFKDAKKILILFNFLFHLSTLGLFVIYLKGHLSLMSIIYFVLAILIHAIVYNTVWYHRYCCHASYKFSAPWLTVFFLWSMPFVFREEAYSIPHQIHHQKTEKAGDPYGPHLGWLGSYLAIESSQKINTNITQDEYNELKHSLNHIGFITSSYNIFQRFGSVENPLYYFLRTVISQIFWCSISYMLGGVDFIYAWYGALFCSTFMIREFNWRGHGGNYRREKKEGWEFHRKSYALNQPFYGYLVSEWHDNHHNFPMSANNSFLKNQPDLAFTIIRLMKGFGMVESYHDFSGKFKQQISKERNL